MSVETGSEKAIYYEAVAIQNPGRRAAYLDAVCGNDGELKVRIQSLLDADGQANSFLDDSPVNSLLEAPKSTAEFDRPREHVGTMIGRYKILEKIGEGGFGVVYMAEQREPMQRRVALKIIKEGMDTRQVIARFEAERQALSLMNHPNIAMVLDAGTTESGRPYFAMELVRGVPVTEYCDENNLSTDDRLKLFADVCSAIQHAHQKGIIHRDVKPSNVLVTNDGDRPIAKVIDFGIAKATQGRLTNKTLFTQFRQFIGTPAYMSPEQAQMSARDVDTRTDIYSLGVLLYELLTGTTPLDAKALKRAALDEVCRLIREDEPPKPSTRLSTLSQVDRAKIAHKRRAEPEKLGLLMRGDLDWIVMKAIEKDRARRYATAEALAEDIRRHLSQQPVLAAPPSAAYRLRRLARRNRGLLLTSGVVVAALVIGTTVAIWQALDAIVESQRANRAEQESSQNLLLAKRNLKRAQEKELLATRHRYAAEMILLSQQGRNGINATSVWDLLQRHVPAPGDSDLRGFEWRALWHQYQGELFTLEGHRDEIQSVAFSPDGEWIASGTGDGTVQIWSLQTRKKVWQYSGTDDELSECGCDGVDVSFSTDGTRLFTALGGKTSTLWNVSELPKTPERISDIPVSGRIVTQDNRILGQTEGTMALSDSGGTILTKFIDIQYDGTDQAGKTHGGKIWDFDSSLQGKVVSCGGDSDVKVWDQDTGTLLTTLPSDTTDVLDVAFSPDGRTIATCSGYGVVAIWSDEGRQLCSIQLSDIHDELAFCSNGKSLLVSERYGGVRVLETATLTEQSFIPARGRVAQLEGSPTEPNLFATVGFDGVIRLWDITPRNPILEHPWPVRSVQFSPVGKVLAVGMTNGAVRFWDTNTLKRLFDIPPAFELNQFEFPPMLLRPYKQDFVSFSPSGRLVATIGPSDKITIWNLVTQQSVHEIEHPEEEGKFWSVRFARDDYLLAGTLTLEDVSCGIYGWNLENASPDKFCGNSNRIGAAALAIAPDGSMMASGHDDALHWRLDQRLLANTLSLAEFTRGEQGCTALRFSSDGHWLATGDLNSNVCVWDTKNWQYQRLHLRDSIVSVDFSPGNQRLVASDTSGMTKMWDVTTWQPVATYRGAVADFATDGKTLAVGCLDHFASQVMPSAGRVVLLQAPPLKEIDSK